MKAKNYEPGTIGYELKKLPMSARQKATKNCLKEGNRMNRRAYGNRISAWFSWSCTPQKSKYWNDIHFKAYGVKYY